MSGKKHGKDSAFAIEDTGSVLRTISTWCDSIDLDRSTDMADATTIGSEDKEFLAGLSGGSLSLSGKWDSLVMTGPDVVLSALFAAKTLTQFEYGPEGGTAGSVKYSGDCYVEKYVVSSPLEGIVKFSATIRVTGAVTRGAYA